MLVIQTSSFSTPINLLTVQMMPRWRLTRTPGTETYLKTSHSCNHMCMISLRELTFTCEELARIRALFSGKRFLLQFRPLQTGRRKGWREPTCTARARVLLVGFKFGNTQLFTVLLKQWYNRFRQEYNTVTPCQPIDPAIHTQQKGKQTTATDTQCCYHLGSLWSCSHGSELVRFQVWNVPGTSV